MKVLFAGIYVFGFAGVFWFNATQMPVTISLAFLRTVVWPIWCLTGWPHGEPMPMD